jgi:cytochrome oxidase Cu insertion factor (SCO1/SenC/PrrC family)
VIRRLDGSTSEEQVAAAIDAVRRTPERVGELVALLPESLRVYGGRSSAEVTRLRGYLLAAFADTGLPPDALPYVLETLESGHEPYEVAGAAIALRGFEGPAEEVEPYLERAQRNMSGADSIVSFEAYDPRWPYAKPTTAAAELSRTSAELGERAAHARACCHEPALAEEQPAGVPFGVELEDQHGRATTFERFFVDKPSLVTFFYTRCESPYKCSLTVTKVGRVQALLEERGLAGAMRLAAITYDPEFDLPKRLETYGSDRGVRFGDDVRFFRTTTASGYDQLARYFRLGVGFGPSTVNRHRIEAHLLDNRGEIAESFTRMQWTPEAVLAAADRLLALTS